jgi:hypothetical protein
MNCIPRWLAVPAALLGLSLMAGSSAHATITFELKNNPQPDEENILLDKGVVGNPVFGQTNQSGTTVAFSSVGNQYLTSAANGQAVIVALSNPNDDKSTIPIKDLTIYVPRSTYGDLIINPVLNKDSGTADIDATLTVKALDKNGVAESDATFTYTLSNGNNFVTIIATDGERIVSTTINGKMDAFDFGELKQPRISGLGHVVTTATPEPATMVSALVGVIGLVGLSYRQRRRSRA